MNGGSNREAVWCVVYSMSMECRVATDAMAIQVERDASASRETGSADEGGRKPKGVHHVNGGRKVNGDAERKRSTGCAQTAIGEEAGLLAASLNVACTEPAPSGGGELTSSEVSRSNGSQSGACFRRVTGSPVTLGRFRSATGARGWVW